MRKILLHIIWLSVLLVTLCGCNHRAESAENFSYEIVDGEITITGYHGTERELLFPDEIEKRAVTKIGAYAFSGYDMTSVKLPETLVAVEAYSFEDCNCLEKIEFPDGVTIIGEGAFSHCDALERVVLPKSIERIEDGAFYHCTNLKQINVPTELDYLGVGALAYCDILNPNNYKKTSMSYTVEDLETGEVRTTGSEEYFYESGSKNEEIIRAHTNWGLEALVDIVNRYDEKGRKIYTEKIFWNPDGSNEKSETRWEYDHEDETVTERKTMQDGSTTIVSTNYYEDGVLTRIEYYSNGKVNQCEDYIGQWTTEEIISVDEYGNTMRTEVQCDAFGRYKKMIRTYEGASAPYYMAEYRYDSAGNQIELIEYDYLNNSKSITQYTYERVE